MRTTKPLIFAIVALLPFGAFATGPAHDSGNSPTLASASAPYQTVTPEAHADEHIASTKYVIGAYNDAIAAVNKVNSEKQNVLISAGTGVVDTFVWPQGEFEAAIRQTQDISGGVLREMAEDLQLNDMLISTAAVAGILGVQRVNIYTTWDDDDTTLVPLAYDVMNE